MGTWRERPLTFRCGDDELIGILHEGTSGNSSLGVLVVVGGPQYRVGSHRQFTLMARSLAASGFPVMRFDFRGMGDASGESRTFEVVDEDIRAAVDAFLQDVPELQAIVVFGLCDAASAALMYCASDERVRGVILANPWVRTPQGEAKSYIRHYYGQRLLQATFWRKVLSSEFRFIDSFRALVKSWSSARGSKNASGSTSSRDFIARMRNGLSKFRYGVLILISERDLTAKEFLDLCRDSPDWARLLARNNVAVTHLNDADHTFSMRKDMNASVLSIVNWLRTCGNGNRRG